MAKRESQGMQIALILLVMFSLLMAITTVLFWNQSKKRLAELEATKQQNQTLTTTGAAAAEENRQLKKWLGAGEEASVESVKKDVEEQLLLLGKNYAEDKRNYRDLSAFLVKTIQDQHQRLSQSSTQEQQLETERDTAREQERTNVQTAEKNHQQASQDLASVREGLDKELQSLRKKFATFEEAAKREKAALTKESTSLAQQVSQLQTQLAALEKQNDRLGTQVNQFRTESFDRPDGRITFVNQALRTVYIDLGRADALRPQATFSVYDVDANNLARVEKKGSIEVTRILSDHLAEGRILDDMTNDPIIAGDLIHSPIFENGVPVRYALAGILDVDGDGESDRQLLRNLIAVNGGVVDAEVDEQGERTGEISIETRYLVLGDEITEQSSGSLRDAMTKILEEAETAGVTTISLGRFLNQIGYHPSTVSIGLGDSVRGSDFELNRRGDFRFRTQVRPASVPTTSP